MTTLTRLTADDVNWPDPVEIARERVIAGAPAARTLILEEQPGHQLGLWQITPGEFTTDHAGYIEYIHILSGTGRLIDLTGTATELGPGVTVLLQQGWKGRWVVDQILTKVYTVINTSRASARAAAPVADGEVGALLS